MAKMETKRVTVSELQRFLRDRGVVVGQSKRQELLELVGIAKDLGLPVDPELCVEDRPEVIGEKLRDGNLVLSNPALLSGSSDISILPDFSFVDVCTYLMGHGVGITAIRDYRRSEDKGQRSSYQRSISGISFQEFKKFCQFLNNLDDFTIAMKMYTFAQQPVSQEEFQRSVKVCTGFTLGDHVVNTVFQIFDSDGDGHLSHQEFISIMKDRLHRGARSHLMHTQNSWEAFRSCVKTEMKSV